jgi:ABC-type sugar transport system ATPase subunit
MTEAARGSGRRTRILEARGIAKRFGGVEALADVSVAFRTGEAHGVVGENGAGKSTLLKVVTGGLHADAGEVLLDGEAIRLSAPRAATEAGIALVEQEPTVVPEMSVAENIYLGQELTRFGRVREREQRQRCESLIAEVGFALRLGVPAGTLSVGQQQELVILRALMRDAHFLILDEPTAALTSEEAEKLFRQLRLLRTRGLAVVFVSHALDQVLSLCDRVTVLRDGKLVLTDAIAKHDRRSLVRAMIGRDLDTASNRRSAEIGAAPVLTVTGLTRAGAFEDITFSVYPGEVLGIAGLIGSGRTEVARALVGADSLDAGTVAINGRSVRLRSPRLAFRNGVAMVPEDRRSQGLVESMSIRNNLSLASLPTRVTTAGWIRRRRERRLVESAIGHLQIKTQQPRLNVMSLSGGNQQKVVFGKWLSAGGLSVLIADEPTRGVDVGAKEAIYDLVDELRRQGLAIVLISSELEEVLRIADRMLVMRNGRIAGELGPEAMDAEASLKLAFGI